MVHPFQEDSYRTTFQAEVVAQQGTWVRLNTTYFYPTSGGQPHDTGILESATRRLEVGDVQVREAQVWHRLEGKPFTVGTSVSGTLDWARRYQHMQRHSAQHLLSQVFVQLDPAFETRSVSLQGPVCTLDLAGNPQDDTLRQAEVQVNRATYANLEIRAFEVGERDLGSYSLRRPPKVSGRIRLVQMGDELSACGGTHLRRTGEALPIKITRLELSATKRALTLNRQRLARTLAERLHRETVGQPVIYQLPPEDADLLGPLAQALVSYEGTVALLGAVQGDRAQLLFARHESGQGDMKDVLQVALTRLGGRGGGSAVRAQGSGDAAGLAEALRAAAEQLR